MLETNVDFDDFLHDFFFAPPPLFDSSFYPYFKNKLKIKTILVFSNCVEQLWAIQSSFNDSSIPM